MENKTILCTITDGNEVITRDFTASQLFEAVRDGFIIIGMKKGVIK